MVENRRIGGRAATFRHEPGGGPALIFIHGSADNHHVYDRLFDLLPSFERYAIDLPGRAGSDGPPLGTVAEMESFLSRFVDSEVEGDYVVIGHSLGGGVAIEHALGPSTRRLRAIALVASGARLRVHPLILQLFEDATRAGRSPPLPPGLFEPGVDPELVTEASRYREVTPVGTGAMDWRAADAFDRMGDLHDTPCPALIVTGSQDPLTPPKYAQYLAAHIPKNELHVIDGAGHMLPLERPVELATHIKRFLTKIREAKRQSKSHLSWP